MLMLQAHGSSPTDKCQGISRHLRKTIAHDSAFLLPEREWSGSVVFSSDTLSALNQTWVKASGTQASRTHSHNNTSDEPRKKKKPCPQLPADCAVRKSKQAASEDENLTSTTSLSCSGPWVFQRYSCQQRSAQRLPH